jgi:hypothetical protein
VQIIENPKIEMDSTKVIPIDTTTRELENFIEPDRFIRMEEVYIEERKFKQKKTNKNVKIEDRTTNTVKSSSTSQSEAGTMAYVIPEQMQVGKSYKVKLRISRDGNKAELIDGDRHITIYDSTVQSKVIIESIRVESIMSATLVGDSDKFQITPLSTELQNIEKMGYTEWEWVIKPMKGGKNFLKLIVKVRLKEDGDEFFKDITVFDKSIDVSSNPRFTIWQFIQNYWQWIMSSVIIPLVIWWWKNRKDQSK